MVYRSWDDIIQYQVPHDVDERVDLEGEHQVYVVRLGVSSGRSLLAIDVKELKPWDELSPDVVLRQYPKSYDSSELQGAIKLAGDAVDLVRVA